MCSLAVKYVQEIEPITLKTYEDQEIDHGLDIVRLNRLYTPGCGIIFRMCRNRNEYNFERIVIAYDRYNKAIACILVDNKYSKPDWTTYSIDPEVPNEYKRINVWVRPKFRRQGIGRKLMDEAQVNDLLGVECYDTGYAAKKLYGKLKKSRIC